MFVRDVLTGTATLVSREDGPDGALLHGPGGLPRISADGRRVAFVTSPGGGTPSQIQVRDIPSGRTSSRVAPMAPPVRSATASAQGRR